MISLDSDAKTSASHGGEPNNRSIEELLEAGMLVVDKPAGPNSHQVSAWPEIFSGSVNWVTGGRWTRSQQVFLFYCLDVQCD